MEKAGRSPPQPQITDEIEIDELSLVDRLPQARRHYADGFDVYQEVVYAQAYARSDTYTMEGCNAELRHYIAVLARKTHCVCRSDASLHDSIRLMVHAYNRQQPHRFRYPQNRRPPTDFVSP